MGVLISIIFLATWKRVRNKKLEDLFFLYLYRMGCKESNEQLNQSSVYGWVNFTFSINDFNLSTLCCKALELLHNPITNYSNLLIQTKRLISKRNLFIYLW